jgi:hypothetical protein
VAEPGASSNTVAREDALFDRLLGGMSWVESAWSANYQLSYVNTVVGDPLMRFQVLLPGGLNLSGDVDASDLAIMVTNFNRYHHGWSDGDLTGDGVVNVRDLNILLTNFFSPPLSMSSNAAAGGVAPEPTTSTLLGFTVLAAVARRRGFRETQIACNQAPAIRHRTTRFNVRPLSVRRCDRGAQIYD